MSTNLVSISQEVQLSIAGKQLGTKDERNLFPVMIRLVDEIRPRAVTIENVRGILTLFSKTTATTSARNSAGLGSHRKYDR